MNRFWDFANSTIAWAVTCLFFCPVVFAENSANITRVQITPSVTTVTFKLVVSDPAQPVTLKVAKANDLENTLSSLLLMAVGTGVPIDNVQVKAIAATGDNPHKIELTFPPNTIANSEIECSIVERKITASPRYRVVTPNVSSGTRSTQVIADLMIGNESPNVIKDAAIGFQGGGIGWLASGFTLIEGKSMVVSGAASSSLTDPTNQLLAFSASALEFKLNPTNTKLGTAKAVLQLPMRGNWPKDFALPGTILFRFESTQLAPFVPAGSVLTDRNGSFQTLIGSESLPFTDLAPVVIESTTKYSNFTGENWPQVNYDATTTYKLKAADASMWAFVRVGNDKILLSTLTPSLTLPPVKQSTQLYIFPGQESVVELERHLKNIDGLVEDEMKLECIQKELKRITCEMRLIDKNITQLVMTIASKLLANAPANEIADHRADLNVNRQLASQMILEFNDLVLTHHSLLCPAGSPPTTQAAPEPPPAAEPTPVTP